MSHFTRVKTQMVEQKYLVQALQELGYVPEIGNVEIRGFAGKRTPVAIKIPTKNLGYDIGFQKSGEAYEIVADWWGIHGINKNTFQQEVTQRYAYHAALGKLEEQGFALVSEESQTGGRIHLTLRRMA